MTNELTKLIITFLKESFNNEIVTNLSLCAFRRSSLPGALALSSPHGDAEDTIRLIEVYYDFDIPILQLLVDQNKMKVQCDKGMVNLYDHNSLPLLASAIRHHFKTFNCDTCPARLVVGR